MKILTSNRVQWKKKFGNGSCKATFWGWKRAKKFRSNIPITNPIATIVDFLSTIIDVSPSRYFQRCSHIFSWIASVVVSVFLQSHKTQGAYFSTCRQYTHSPIITLILDIFGTSSDHSLSNDIRIIISKRIVMELWLYLS